jgi:hypothetical protein
LDVFQASQLFENHLFHLTKIFSHGLRIESKAAILVQDSPPKTLPGNDPVKVICRAYGRAAFAAVAGLVTNGFAAACRIS